MNMKRISRLGLAGMCLTALTLAGCGGARNNFQARGPGSGGAMQAKNWNTPTPAGKPGTMGTMGSGTGAMTAGSMNPSANPAAWPGNDPNAGFRTGAGSANPPYGPTNGSSTTKNMGAATGSGFRPSTMSPGMPGPGTAMPVNNTLRPGQFVPDPGVPGIPLPSADPQINPPLPGTVTRDTVPPVPPIGPSFPSGPTPGFGGEPLPQLINPIQPPQP
jgi:hypothetical protein